MKQGKQSNPGLRVVELWQVTHSCGHTTRHEKSASTTELYKLKDEVCPECRELEK